MGSKRNKRVRKSQTTDQSPVLADETDRRQRNEKILFYLTCFMLFGFGAYQSVIFFGHQIVPNSDFERFYNAGKAILSFRLPGTFQRTPVTGMLQCFLTPLMSGDYANLKAGWMVNAILHPFNAVLLLLVARKLIKDAAKWFVVLCMINPWVLYLMTEPIAETTLLFFLLLTVLFIFKRSKWCYLFAAIATMVRYECAALIFAAFLMDMILGSSKKERLWGLGLSILASIPLGLWLWASRHGGGENSLVYLNIFKEVFSKSSDVSSNDNIGILKHMGIIWSVGYKSLFSTPFTSGKQIAETVVYLCKITAGVTFILGCGLAIFKKNWKILVLAVFLVPYFIIHAYYPFPIPRFHMPSFWIALLISLYGLYEAWHVLNEKIKISKFVVVILQLIITVSFFFWFAAILPNLEVCAKVCPKAKLMPWLMMALLLVFATMTLYVRRKGYLKEVCVLAIMMVAVTSNQISVSWLLNTGMRDAEFKMLADWYCSNVKGQQKLATSMRSVVSLYLPRNMKNKIISLRNMKGDNLLEYAIKFQKKGVVYVAWDLRIESIRKEKYYHISDLKNLQPLAAPRDVGPYKFVTQIKNGKRFVNIFKLQDVEKYRLKTPPVAPTE